MIRDSYDIPAFKFGIMITQREDYTYDLNEQIRSGTVQFVPFEAFDGLTLEEAVAALKRDSFIFVCYTEWLNEFTQMREISIQQTIIFSPQYVKNNKLLQIDRAIEIEMSKFITEPHSSFTSRRVAKCFFERYQDKSSQRTEERLMRLHPVKEQNQNT